MSKVGIDHWRDRLHRAGWSVGETCAGRTWLITGTNGENVIHATAETQAKAWQRACEQAAAVGMLAAPKPGDFDPCRRL
jgi:hypothetical protein